jgi:hypothetical protein
MFLLDRTQDKERMVKNAPEGPGFSSTQSRAAKVMEIYCTSFSDPGEECVFVLRGQDGRVLAEQRVSGY